MKTLLNLSLLVICLSLVSCSREKGSGQNGGDTGTGAGSSSAQGFDTPDAALTAYGNALVEGNGAAYRKVAAKDTGAIKGLDAIIQFEKDKSPEEAARINLKALAPMQGFGDVPSKRFPAEVDGDSALIVQLFEREIAFKKEIHFRKFKFSKSGGKWFLVGSEFGEASKLPDMYAWNKGVETTIATSSDRKAEWFIPQDALAALIVHPQRAAASEIGQALLKLNVVQDGLQQSQMKPDDIERIIYTIGIPTEDSENDCTVVHFAKPKSRETLLKEEFGDQPYEQVQFQGETYYRYADESAADQSDDFPAAANKQDAEAVAADTTTVLAKYPDDFRPDANGHTDSNGNGIWVYHSSETQNPTLPQANLRQLNWDTERKRYQSPLRGKNNTFPSIDQRMHPSPDPPHFAVLRWQSSRSAAIRIRGKFSKLADAKDSNGVHVLVFVDGEQKFGKDVGPRDARGVDFDFAALVKRGSVVDFVVDPKADAYWDSTMLTATIEKPSPTILARYPDDFQTSANGHADSSDSGNWFYYSSQTTNPTLSNADLNKLRWSKNRNTYVSPRGKMGNDHPTVGKGLDPSPFAPRYAVLRWESRTSAEIHLRGNFKKLATAAGSDGVKAFIIVDGEQKFSEKIKGMDTIGVDFDLSASVKPGSVIDFVVDPNGSAKRDLTYLTATLERSGASAAAKPELVDTPKIPSAISEESATLRGTAVYFPDDQTLVSTDEQRLRSLISGSPAQTPLTKKLSQLDLKHDLVAVAAIEGYQDQLAGLLNALAEQSGSAELGGLSVLPRHALFAVATLDLSGDTLLNLAVEAPNEQSAGEVEGGFDLLLDAVEGLRHVVPKESPLLGLVEQLVKRTNVQTAGSQVVLKTQMPVGFADFVSKEAEAAIAGLAEMIDPRGEGTPSHDPDLPSETDIPGKPKETVYREPPKDHPEFRDLAVESHDCRVFFPGKPTFTEQVVKIAEGNVHVANFQGRTTRATYMFEIYTYPKAFVAKTGAEALLKQTRDNVVDAPNGGLISSHSKKYQDSPALDFVYYNPDTTGGLKGHCRIVMRGNRVYLLEVVGAKVPPAEIAVFHDSLAPFALATGGAASPPKTADKPKLPVPDEDSRAAALKLVGEVYKSKFDEAKTAEAKSALAAAMIEDSAGINAPQQRFVMLDVARKIAVALPEVATTFQAIDRLDAEFQIESVALKIQSLIELNKSRVVANERMAFVDRLVEVAEQAIATDAFKEGAELLTLAQTYSRQARDFVLVRQITERLKEAKKLTADFSSLEPSLKALHDNPTDPEASLMVGRFRCFGQGNWHVGLTLLGQCSDERLKMLAQSDLVAPTASKEQIAVGDQWWELASEHEGLFQKQIRQRSAHWYRLARSGVDGLEKQKLDSRLEQVAPAP